MVKLIEIPPLINRNITDRDKLEFVTVIGKLKFHFCNKMIVKSMGNH